MQTKQGKAKGHAHLQAARSPMNAQGEQQSSPPLLRKPTNQPRRRTSAAN